MIHEMVMRSIETHFTTNEDGTHTVRVVTASEELEFTCVLRPHLTVRLEVDDKNNRVSLANGNHATFRSQATLRLDIEGDMLPDPEGHNWRIQVLNRDECGNPKEKNGHQSIEPIS